MLEALVTRDGPPVVTGLRQALQGALRDVRRGFLLRDEAAYSASLVALEGIAASIGAQRIVMICRELESQRESALAAPGLDRLHWETEAVLDELRSMGAAPGDATLRRRRDWSGRFTRDRSKPPRKGSLPPS